jgi:hypothetical protein
MFVDPGEKGSGRAHIGFEVKELGISPVSPDFEDTIIGVSNTSIDSLAGLSVSRRGREVLMFPLYVHPKVGAHIVIEV